MKVSVLVVTYNHEKSVAQALDSVLMQQVSFDYEIIITEDCSTDSTRDIIIGYQERYPDRIRSLLSEHNLGLLVVLVRGIQASQGQYIALLDGDDYWTSPHKLQKQVDFLDNHPECVTCFHNVLVFYDDNSQEPYYSNPPDQKEISTLEDLLEGCFIMTCSTMFRRSVLGKLPDWFSTTEVVGDWAAHIAVAEYGEIGYINEVMGAYRKHSGGAWSGLSERQQIEIGIKLYGIMNANLNLRYNETIKRMIFKLYYDLAKVHYKNGDTENARTCLRKCIAERPVDKLIPLIEDLWRQVREQQAWIGELGKGKAWLEEQRDNWLETAEERERIIQEQQAWIGELEKGKAWLEEQRGDWQRLAEERERVIREQPGNWQRWLRSRIGSLTGKLGQ